MKQLNEESRSREIALVCFCEDETLCHRSIIGGILLKLGAWNNCDSTYGACGKRFLREMDDASPSTSQSDMKIGKR